VKRLLQISLAVITASLSGPSAGFTWQTSTAPSHTAGQKAQKKGPSPQQIAEAKAQGLVWVNIATHVYHKDGPLYGTTRLGKFMKEEDAQKAGYRLASPNSSPGKKGRPAPS
jgi:hypothetical protein